MSMVILAQQGDDGGIVVSIGLLILLGAGFFAYCVPTLIAFARGVPNKWSVAVINFFLGWTYCMASPSHGHDCFLASSSEVRSARPNNTDKGAVLASDALD